MSAIDAVTWEFALIGDPSDLSVLCSATRGQSIVIQKRDDCYVLSMPSQPEDRDYNALYLFAQEQIEVLNGIGHLVDGGFRSVSLSDHLFGVDEEGVRCTTAITVHSLEGRIRAGILRVAINGELGPDPIELAASHFLRAATASDEAFQALAVVGIDAPTWSELYVAFELAKSGTGGAIERVCDVTTVELERFRRTANSFKILGRLARHGPKPHVPPDDPMQYCEALQFVRGLVRAWLKHASRLATDVGAQA